jgi:hypothetical protein
MRSRRQDAHGLLRGNHSLDKQASPLKEGFSLGCRQLLKFGLRGSDNHS